MKTQFKISLLFLSLVIITSCDKDSGIGQFDQLIIENENNPNKFKQVTFLVSLNNPEYGYLNLHRIDSMEVYVNANYWGTFTSEIIDTTNNTDLIVQGVKYSNRKINYLFIAPYQSKTENLETAGDYVDFLYERIVLTPGDYICEIKKIKFKDINDNVITKNVQVYANFSVKENTTSSYIGDLNIPIN